jgi:hypothetical protein
MKRFLDERNHLLLLARHAPTADATVAAARSLAISASYAQHDIVAPVLSGERPHTATVRTRLSAFGSFTAMLPGALRDRARDARRSADLR